MARFTEGQPSWNKGKRVQTNTGKTHFKKGRTPHNKAEHIEVVCVQCESKLTVPPCFSKRKFCSHKCFSTHRKESSWQHPAKGIPRPTMRGSNSPVWKGGSAEERHSAMGRTEYKEWREQVFARDNYTCQMCQQYSGVLHADHIEKWSDAEELRYVVDNGRTLCVPCHYYITFKRKMMPGQRWCNYMAGKRG